MLPVLYQTVSAICNEAVAVGMPWKLTAYCPDVIGGSHKMGVLGCGKLTTRRAELLRRDHAGIRRCSYVLKSGSRREIMYS